MLHCIHLLVADFAGVLFGSEHVQGVAAATNNCMREVRVNRNSFLLKGQNNKMKKCKENCRCQIVILLFCHCKLPL